MGKLASLVDEIPACQNVDYYYSFLEQQAWTHQGAKNPSPGIEGLQSVPRHPSVDIMESQVD